MVLGHDGGEGLVHRVHRNHVHVLLIGQAELQEDEVAGHRATGGGEAGATDATPPPVIGARVTSPLPFTANRG
jgi:hypothetical protein